MSFVNYVLHMHGAAQRSLDHPDPEVRQRAAARGQRWREVLSGMLSGRITVGSRTPVADLPAWVTPVVVRGGFATGRAAAATPPDPDEVELAETLGLQPDRRSLFDWWLTPQGRSVLLKMLDDNAFRAQYPEHTALMVVAVLQDRGDDQAADALVADLRPFADQLRLVPFATTPSQARPGTVHRHTVARAKAALTEYRPSAQVLAQQEALTVWIPLRDEVEQFWAELLTRPRPTPEDLARAAHLVATHRDAAARHTCCAKYRRRGESLPILIEELAQLGSAPWPSERARRVLAAIEDKRGLPGSDRAVEVRTAQAAQAARPLFSEIGGVLATRLAKLRDDEGIPSRAGRPATEGFAHPVTAAEATPRVPAGTPIPEVLETILHRATASDPHTLVHPRGVIPSAEVLAEVAPQLTAWQLLKGPDVRVARLLAATHLAFSRRRSLLLLNLEHQVNLDELPWVRALPGGALNPDVLLDSARDLASEALTAFPDVPFPNQLVQELQFLTTQAGKDLPWTYELAADIFTGQFTQTFVDAARLAAEMLRGTLHESYYGLDCAWLATANLAAFTQWCHQAAPGDWSVAANGAIIERQQIATTHNLAVAVLLGAEPRQGWNAAGDQAAARACWHLAHGRDRRQTARMVRQAVFCYSMVASPRILAEPHQEAHFETYGPSWLRDDLRHALAGEPVTPLLGWQTHH
ncbi:MAG: hypothetical protein Q4D96_13090 [Propionibacteriaceae bacterium]|nr:hypothetical protein [Propionibacteriaceae bacterium]